MENENKIENLENKLKRDKRALRIAIIICVVMMIAAILVSAALQVCISTTCA